MTFPVGFLAVLGAVCDGAASVADLGISGIADNARRGHDEREYNCSIKGGYGDVEIISHRVGRFIAYLFVQ